jgi:hypothetical protein
MKQKRELHAVEICQHTGWALSYETKTQAVYTCTTRFCTQTKTVRKHAV